MRSAVRKFALQACFGLAVQDYYLLFPSDKLQCVHYGFEKLEAFDTQCAAF